MSLFPHFPAILKKFPRKRLGRATPTHTDVVYWYSFPVSIPPTRIAFDCASEAAQFASRRPLITERMCRSFANEELINHDRKGRANGRFWKGYLFICGQLWPLRSGRRTLEGCVGDSYAALAINIRMNGWRVRLGCHLLAMFFRKL